MNPLAVLGILLCLAVGFCAIHSLIYPIPPFRPHPKPPKVQYKDISHFSKSKQRRILKKYLEDVSNE